MNNIFFTSDLHFCHDRGFIYEPRGFSNIAAHDAAIIDNFNHIVDDEDDLYILGDLMLNDNVLGIKCLNSLPGRKHIILGNHDTDARAKLYSDIRGFVDMKWADMVKINGYNFFLCHYPTMTFNMDAEKPLNCMVINLFGHTHQKTNFYQDMPIAYHVGVDSHDMKPVAFDEVISDITMKIDECRRML